MHEITPLNQKKNPYACCDKSEKGKAKMMGISLNIVNKHCPECADEGFSVKNITAKHILKKDKSSEVGNHDYYLCVNKECSVSYFNNEAKKQFSIEDTRRPIWFKKNATPVISCYCNSITEEEAIEAVKETGLSAKSEILNFLRSNVKNNCKITNPSGKCCSASVKQAVEKAQATDEIILKQQQEVDCGC